MWCLRIFLCVKQDNHHFLTHDTIFNWTFIDVFKTKIQYHKFPSPPPITTIHHTPPPTLIPPPPSSSTIHTIITKTHSTNYHIHLHLYTSRIQRKHFQRSKHLHSSSKPLHLHSPNSENTTTLPFQPLNQPIFIIQFLYYNHHQHAQHSFHLPQFICQTPHTQINPSHIWNTHPTCILFITSNLNRKHSKCQHRSTQLLEILFLVWAMHIIYTTYLHLVGLNRTNLILTGL